MEIYLYRRRGNTDYATCDRARYVEFSQHKQFDVMIAYSEKSDGAALMKIAADLANRRPLDQLYRVCETQGRVNTDSLHEYVDKAGDLLAGIALDIRRAIT